MGKKRRAPALFITATDTGVGKTVVTAALGMAFRGMGHSVAPFKPFASGAVLRGEEWVSPDALFLQRALESPLSLREINPILYRPPLAPSVAGRVDRKRFALPTLRRALERLRARHDLVLVEGIGGLLVPLRWGYLLADFVRDLGLPLLVVARPGLGTLNHAHLTVEAALRRKIKVAGVVVNRLPPVHRRDLAIQTNITELKMTLPVPFLGSLDEIPGVDVARGRLGGLAARTAVALRLDHIRTFLRLPPPRTGRP